MPAIIKPKELVRDYTQLWSTTNQERRHELTHKLLNKDATIFLNRPQEMRIHGLSDIETHISRVNGDLTENDHAFHILDEAISGNQDAVKYSFQRLDSTGKVLGSATGFILCDDEGRIISDHMFFE